jgi:hypothetical protein
VQDINQRHNLNTKGKYWKNKKRKTVIQTAVGENSFTGEYRGALYCC